MHEVFAYLDNPARLSTRRNRDNPNALPLKLMRDPTRTPAPSSVDISTLPPPIIHEDRVILDEQVTQYEPPTAKTWETLGEPMLLVIGAYRMGFGIADGAARAKLHVFIDYDLPRNSFAKVPVSC